MYCGGGGRGGGVPQVPHQEAIIRHQQGDLEFNSILTLLLKILTSEAESLCKKKGFVGPLLTTKKKTQVPGPKVYTASSSATVPVLASIFYTLSGGERFKLF